MMIALTAAQRVMVEEQADIPTYVARLLCRRHYQFVSEFDDLVGEGGLELTRAAQDWKSARGAAFRTYAITRVRYAMYDYLCYRRRQNGRSRRATEQKFSMVPLDAAKGITMTADPARAVHVSQFWSWVNTLNGKRRCILALVAEGHRPYEIGPKVALSPERVAWLTKESLTKWAVHSA